MSILGFLCVTIKRLFYQQKVVTLVIWKIIPIMTWSATANIRAHP